MDDLLEVKSPNPLINIELDWEQYFKDFCNMHGKYPVICDGVLLFPDGYRYSASSYEGPEYPPPTDKRELHNLKLFYWSRRNVIVKNERDNLLNLVQELESLQRTKSLPLLQKVYSKNDSGEYISDSKKLDIEYLKKRLEWLENDLENCVTQLALLELIVL